MGKNKIVEITTVKEFSELISAWNDSYNDVPDSDGNYGWE